MRTLLLLAAIVSSTAYADPPRHIELATDPLALVHDTYRVDSAYAVTDHVALTGGVAYTHSNDASPWGMTRLEVGVRLFLDHAFQGPFVEAGLFRDQVHGIGYTVDQNGQPAPYDADYTMFGPRASFGWQWTFHDTWTASYAIGTTKAWSISGNVLGAATVGYEQAARVGFVF